ncbi:hypothetical protein IJT93_13225 [bacterium]|nr:hypothetical protein [bacterium]
MKNKNDEDYKDYINYLRYECYKCNSHPDIRKARKMLLSGELRNNEEFLQWIENENARLEPVRRDNKIAMYGTDEEVLELAKRLCPQLLL